MASPQYLDWINAGTYIFGALGIGYLLLSIRSWSGPSPWLKLFGRFCGGLFLICIGASDLAPIVLSPRLTGTGQVQGFHQVHAGRAYYYFEFLVSESDSDSSARVHADYSDKGFYSGDPAVSDGDTVEVTYLEANGEAASIREVKGKHAGWYYQADLRPIGPPIFVGAGLAVITAAVGGLITDIQTKTAGDSSDEKPESILGL